MHRVNLSPPTAANSQTPAAHLPANISTQLQRLLPRLLLVLALATLVSAAFSAATINRQTWLSLKNFQVVYLLPGLLICILPWFTNTLRLWLWTSLLKLSISLKQLFYISVAAEVASAAMPAIIGGGGARVAMLAAQGAAPSIAASLALLETLEDLAFLLLALPLAVWLAPDLFSTEGSYFLSHVGKMRLFQWSPLRIMAALAICAGLFIFLRSFAPARWREKTRQAIAAIAGGLSQCWATFRVLIAKGKWRFALAVGLAALQWSSRYSLLGLILAGLNLAPNFLEIFFTQWVVFTIMNFFPSPGATGGAELTFALMYQSLIPQNLLGVLGAAWRMLTFTLPVALATGLLFLLAEKRQK